MDILVLLILLLIGWALYRGWRVYRMVQRFREDPYAEMRRQAQESGSSGSTGRRRSTGNSFFDMFFGFSDTSKPKRRKKIPDDVGEYVPFTEIIDAKSAASQTSPEPYKTEEQIEDVEWKDL